MQLPVMCPECKKLMLHVSAYEPCDRRPVCTHCGAQTHLTVTPVNYTLPFGPRFIAEISCDIISLGWRVPRGLSKVEIIRRENKRKQALSVGTWQDAEGPELADLDFGMIGVKNQKPKINKTFIIKLALKQQKSS